MVDFSGVRRAASMLRPGVPRSVVGPSQNVVVVGAGLAGLSAAMRLRAAGRSVTVLEQGPGPGGRAGVEQLHTADGVFHLDNGPTVLTMPDLIEDCFASLGESMSDWLTLDPVDPLYKAQFADGSELKVHSDTAQMRQAIEDFAGPDEAAGYERYVDFVTKLYRYEMNDFIDRNIDTPLDLLTVNLAKLSAIGGFRKLAPVVNSFLSDERVQRVFSFQSLYAGVAPQQALALYAVIAYMDSVAGVFFPRGGMAAVPLAMAAAAEKAGVQFHYNTTVTKVEHSGGRAHGVITAQGERFACDAVVLNPDLPVARQQLLNAPLRRKLTYSPSCWLMLAGSSAAYPDMAHHTISFGQAWSEVFAELTSGKFMSDPSILISAPTVSDPSLAPAGKHCYYVLLPTPNMTGGQDWASVGSAFREEALATLEQRGYPGFADSIEVEHITTPQDWLAKGMAAGAPFAAAHLFSQTGPFRPSNMWGENVVFAGSGTLPGVGVPMVLISGRLAAERITGPQGDSS